MTAYVIVQHPHFEDDMPPPGHELIFAKTFWSKSQFGEALREAISALHLLDDARPKALVLNTHGEAMSGTHLNAVTEHVDLWEYRDCFGVLPNNLVVYVNACWGGYASTAAAIQSGIRVPTVVGPLVEIYPSLANGFQNALLDLLDVCEPSARALMGLVRRFNNDEMLRRNDYGDQDWLFGMSDASGEFFPPEAIGTQLAASVEEATFRLSDLVKSNGDSGEVVACVVEHEDSGKKLQANFSPLIEVADGDFDRIVGIRFKASYQVISDLTDPVDVGITRLPIINIVALR